MSAVPSRQPTLTSVVPHHDSSFGPAEETAAVRVLRSGRLAPGSEAARLEQLLARLSEGVDAVSLSSASTALTLTLRAFGMRAGDRVALPSYASVELLHAVRASGASPLVCDVDPLTLTISPDDLNRRAGRRLRAVLVGHTAGHPAAVRPFLGREWKVVEDCSEALGAIVDGRPAGAWGDAAIFSFSHTRPVACGGSGGAVASRQASLVRAVRALASCGTNVAGPPHVDGLMGDLNAAIATVQIERLPELIARRASIVARYDDRLRNFRVHRSPSEAHRHAVASRYLIRARDAAQLVSSLRRQGIIARRPVECPLHDQLGLRSRFPMTEAACAEVVALPLYPALADRAVERIASETVRLLG